VIALNLNYVVKIYSRYELALKINLIVLVLKKPQYFVATFPRYLSMQQILFLIAFKYCWTLLSGTEITVSRFYLEINGSELLNISITTAGIFRTALCSDLHKKQNNRKDFIIKIRKLMNLFCVCRVLMLLLDKINMMVFHKMEQKQQKYF